MIKAENGISGGSSPLMFIAVSSFGESLRRVLLTAPAEAI
jgi:hypothetical protein